MNTPSMTASASAPSKRSVAAAMDPAAREDEAFMARTVGDVGERGGWEWRLRSGYR